MTRYDLLTRQQLEVVLKSGVADPPLLLYVKGDKLKKAFGVPGFKYNSPEQWQYHHLMIANRVHTAPPYGAFNSLKEYATKRYTDFLEDIRDRDDVPDKIILITVLNDLIRELDDAESLSFIERVGAIKPGEILTWLQTNQ